MSIRVEGSLVQVSNPFMFLQRSRHALSWGQVGFLVGNLLQFWWCIDLCRRQWGTGFQSVHIFTVKWTCSVFGTGGVSHRKCLTILAVYQFASKAVVKGVSGPWRRVNLLLSPRWVHATE